MAMAFPIVPHLLLLLSLSSPFSASASSAASTMGHRRMMDTIMEDRLSRVASRATRLYGSSTSSAEKGEQQYATLRPASSRASRASRSSSRAASLASTASSAQSSTASHAAAASPYSFDNFPATGAEMPTGIRGVFLQMMNGASNLRLWTEERKARHLEKMAARQRAEREFARTGVWSSHHPGGFRRVAHHSCGKIACDEREDEGCPICRKEGKIEKYGSGCDEYGCQLEKPIPVTGLYGSSTDPPAPPGKE